MTSNTSILIRRTRSRLERVVRSRGWGGAVLLGAAVVVALVASWTAFYTVPSDSVGVVRRFGKYSAEVPPGLHFKLPLGIDRVTLVPEAPHAPMLASTTPPPSTLACEFPLVRPIPKPAGKDVGISPRLRSLGASSGRRPPPVAPYALNDPLGRLGA